MDWNQLKSFSSKPAPKSCLSKPKLRFKFETFPKHNALFSFKDQFESMLIMMPSGYFVHPAQLVPQNVSSTLLACRFKLSKSFQLSILGLQISYGLALPWIGSPNVHRIDGRVLCFDSAYWSVGLYFILGYLKCGATRVITNKAYTPELLMKIIEEHRITTLWSGLFQLVACVKNDAISKMDLSSVNALFCYGAKVPSHIATEINRYFPNAHTTAAYGMTEIGVVCESSFKLQANGAAGPLLADCMAKIVDENGSKCGPLVNGEVCIKKRYKFLGYLDHPELSEAAIDSEGFVKTGDIGYFDANGILYIKDRKKNCILNVFYFRGMILPIEIEEFLISLPDVKEVCVVGVPITPGSELPAALIVRDSNAKLTQQDIFEAVAGKYIYGNAF